jgi:hypothetical protein
MLLMKPAAEDGPQRMAETRPVYQAASAASVSLQ